MDNRLKLTIKYDMKTFWKSLFNFYGWAIGLIFCFPILIYLISMGFSGVVDRYRSQFSILYSFMVFVNMFLIFYFGFTTYERFSLLIQNGISRKTGWKAKIISIIFSSLIVNLYNIALNLNDVIHSSMYEYNIYYEMFGYFFKERWMNVLSMMLYTWVFMFAIGIFGMVCGSIFALLNRRHQRSLLIGLPLAGILLLTIFIRALSSKVIKYSMIDKLGKLVLGYNHLMGHFNPFVSMGFIAVLIMIGMILTRFLYSKLRIKRGE